MVGNSEGQSEDRKIPWTSRIPEEDERGRAASSSPRWKAATRQEVGRTSERKRLKERGAKVHPNSGAGRIKFDGSDENFIIEHKDATQSFTVNKRLIEALHKEAARQGKDGMLIIQFGEYQVECLITRRRI